MWRQSLPHHPYATQAACSEVGKNAGKLFSGAFFLALWLSFSAIGEGCVSTSFPFCSKNRGVKAVLSHRVGRTAFRGNGEVLWILRGRMEGPVSSGKWRRRMAAPLWEKEAGEEEKERFSSIDPCLLPQVHGALLNPPTFLLLIPFQDTWLSLPSAPQTPVLPLLLICARPVSPH